MTTTWKLTGKPSGGGQCEHCPRSLVHRYEVTNTETGAKMIVGRGCLKAITGWTLTAAQAEREIRMIEVRARRAANWATFTETNPADAAILLADCEAYAARYNMAHFGARRLARDQELHRERRARGPPPRRQLHGPPA